MAVLGTRDSVDLADTQPYQDLVVIRVSLDTAVIAELLGTVDFLGLVVIRQLTQGTAVTLDFQGIQGFLLPLQG